MLDNVYIHLGSSHYDKRLILPISNISLLSKPKGGLWASNINSEYSWKNWLAENSINLRPDYKSKWFSFKLAEESRLLIIDDSKKLLDLPHRKCDEQYFDKFDTWHLLDFEEIAVQYDAMEVLISSDYQLYYDLYGWDCDSILVFNGDIIIELESSDA